MTRISETFEAHGHAMMTATHAMSFEITKERHLTARGDCIVAIGSSKGAADLSEEFRRIAGNDSAKITVVLSAEGMEQQAHGRGSHRLRFDHPTDLVARKSAYVCGRTLMISSDVAACDFSRRFIQVIRDQECRIVVQLTAEIERDII